MITRSLWVRATRMPAPRRQSRGFSLDAVSASREGARKCHRGTFRMAPPNGIDNYEKKKQKIKRKCCGPTLSFCKCSLTVNSRARSRVMISDARASVDEFVITCESNDLFSKVNVMHFMMVGGGWVGWFGLPHWIVLCCYYCLNQCQNVLSDCWVVWMFHKHTHNL